MLNRIAGRLGGKFFFTFLVVLIHIIALSRVTESKYIFILVVISVLYIENILTSFSRERHILLLFQVLLWFKFLYLTTLILAQGGSYTSPYGFIEKDSYIVVSIYALLVSYTLRGAYILSSSIFNKKLRVSNEQIEKNINSMPNILILILVIAFTLVTLYKLSNLGGEFSNRLIKNQGGGILHIIGYIGYFLALTFSVKLFMKKKSLSSFEGGAVFLLCLYFGSFFLLLGYRGGFLYPCIFLFILHYYFKFSKFSNFRSIFTLLILFLLFSFEVNWGTGAVRILVTRGDEFTYLNFINAYSSYKDMYLIPMAFNHIDLNAYLVSQNETSLFTGKYNTVIPSLFNWIPRVIYPDKELTTGAVMAIELMPGSITSEGRTSSLTTGIVFEVLYNYGVVLGLLVLFVFYSIIFTLIRYLLSRGGVAYLYSLLLIWNFSFSIFFDDFGGTINKFVTLTMTAILILLLDFILKAFSKYVY